MNYDDNASAFFAVAVIGPYALGAGIYLAVKTMGHFTRKPKYPEVRPPCLKRDVLWFCFPARG